MSQTFTMPAGKYYIGDPCYVIADEDWGPLLEHAEYFSGTEGKAVDWMGDLLFSGSTAYGDGEYQDRKGNKYPVDAGMIGAVPWSHVDDEDRATKCGLVVVFEDDWKCSSEDGYFIFGSEVVIETSDEERRCTSCGSELEGFTLGDLCEYCSDEGEEE